VRLDITEDSTAFFFFLFPFPLPSCRLFSGQSDRKFGEPGGGLDRDKRSLFLPSLFLSPFPSHCNQRLDFPAARVWADGDVAQRVALKAHGAASPFFSFFFPFLPRCPPFSCSYDEAED